MSALDPVEIFRVEAAELLEQIEQGLLDLDQRLDDREQIDSVFRGLHTLKGSGAMFGFDALAAFTHHCETAFDQVRKGHAPATRELVAAVLAARDHMRALVEDPSGDYAGQETALLSQLHAAIQVGAIQVGATQAGATRVDAPQAGAKPQATPEPPPATADTAARQWRIRFALPPNAMVNGVNPLAYLDELRELGACEVSIDDSAVPPLDQLDPTALHLQWTVRLETEHGRSEIEDVFLFVVDDMVLEIDEMGAWPLEALSPAPAPVESKAEAPATPQQAAAQPTSPKTAAPQAAATPPKTARRSVESVRVPADRLDELMDRVGELVIAQSRLSQIAAAGLNEELRAVSEEIENLSNELRGTMMVLRMVPVGTLFERFRRLAHDLQRETGKQIELVTEGESTEMDKTVIERLADPLVHIIRNSADHGLETPEERQAAGKPPAGRITLAARQSGGEVIISVSDDGRGIDCARVRAKAEANGLVAPGQVLSEKEALHMIFQPGFSTAAKVTNLSGRGVGMDVVKKTIESLRGAIDVESWPGEGSEIGLRIPLTLAIIDGLLVRVGGARYVIPLAAVEECLELSLEDDAKSRGRSLLSLRGSLVPFLRLREIFQTGSPPDPHQKVVVVATGAERVGLVVDQIIGDHQTVIKSMSKLHEDVETFSGATILGDGSVALILDIVNLVAVRQDQEAQMRAIA
ncbi:two-component system chemotaxis sensor kinase CheA [Rhodoblastus acidophilus]|uniref:chemotaxis protein CheA n=1 Tax=Rhodoblastus acidophilus TaxID=1074 RepID=UPI002224FDDA|nr:chemotaxis protein CheA [Rhodoblastus acidophilus]MCW2286063.1 two-component system chemotaxis sensor kinase CheA [Rhodoblastus acidophilus]MCW2334957.1 two-component system chemotaxis sensor kinase CheA [Rhodoblastus acidophilus]